MRSGFPPKQDSLGRRSRFKRQPTGKRVVLTERDIGIFRLLWCYRFLSSDRIVSYFNPKSPKRLIERLGDLYHESHHVTRPSAQWRRAKAERYPAVYELTKTGLAAYINAEPSLILPHPTVSFGGAINRQVLQFEHALQISSLLFDIEHLIAEDEIRSLMVERDILAKASVKLNRTIDQTRLQVTIPKSPFMPLQKTAHQTWIVPDALFGIEHRANEGSTYRFYALEVERLNPIRRRSIDKASTLKKLLAYQALLQANTIRQQLSLPNLFLIIAAKCPNQLLKIKEMADQIWSKNEQRFLLFVPPEDDEFSNSPFAEATEKWLEHFQS